MTGKTVALTDRDKRVLVEVSRFGVMNREQLMRLGLFSSKTRANERLKRLVHGGYLSAKRQPLPAGGPRFIYFPGPSLDPSRTVRRRIGEASELFVDHQLGLVDVRLAFEQFTVLKRWLTEKDLTTRALTVIPDAFVEYEASGLIFSAFVEYDRGTEPLKRIEAKIRAYLELAFSGHFERTFKRRFFRALIVTESAKRLTTISAAAAEITTKVVRLTSLKELSRHGPLASIWWRPGASSPESLTLL